MVDLQRRSTKCGIAKNQRFLAGRHPIAFLAPQREGGWGDAPKRERHLILLLMAVLAPTPALAEICDKLRPNWIQGPSITQLAEAIALFSTLPALILIAASALAVIKRSQWGALACVVLWSGYVSLVAMVDPDGTKELARLEGCMASPALFILAVAAICSAMILYTLPRETRL